MKKTLASTERQFATGNTPTAMVRLTDLLGNVAMRFLHECEEQVAGRYVIEVRQDGSLMSMRATVEPFEDGEAGGVEPTAEALAEMYEQIVPQALAYFRECGERPPLMDDVYDRFEAAGFALGMVERVTGARVLQ